MYNKKLYAPSPAPSFLNIGILANVNNVGISNEYAEESPRGIYRNANFFKRLTTQMGTMGHTTDNPAPSGEDSAGFLVLLLVIGEPILCAGDYTMP